MGPGTASLLWLGTPPLCETSQEEIPSCLGLGGCCLQGLGHTSTSVPDGDWGPAGATTEAHLFLVLLVLPPTVCFLLLPPHSVLGVPGRSAFSRLSPFSPHLPVGRCLAHWPPLQVQWAGQLSQPSRSGGGLWCLQPASLSLCGREPLGGPLPQQTAPRRVPNLCLHFMVLGLREE